VSKARCFSLISSSVEEGILEHIQNVDAINGVVYILYWTVLCNEESGRYEE